mgnify:CR=1 FL=1
MEKQKTSSLRWLIALRGVLLIAFGLLAFFLPDVTILALVIYFGIVAIISGLIAFVHFGLEKNWVYIFEGILSIFLGILVIVYPGLTAAVFVWFLVLWLLIVGMMVFVAGIAGPGGTPRAMLILSGIVLLLLGVLLILQPIWMKTLEILYFIGGLSLLSGIFMLLFAMFAKSETVLEEKATEEK